MKVWNIGAEGQLILGAVASSGMGLWLGDNGVAGPAGIALMLAAGAAAGALWAALAALPRAYLNTDEVISTLMLNFVALGVMNYLIFSSFSYWRDTERATFPAGRFISDSMFLPRFVGRLHVWSVRRPGCGRSAVVGAALDQVGIRGAGHGRLPASGSLLGHAGRPEDPVGPDGVRCVGWSRRRHRGRGRAAQPGPAGSQPGRRVCRHSGGRPRPILAARSGTGSDPRGQLHQRAGRAFRFWASHRRS